MNKNDECEIVKDLAIQYTENLINEKSRIFVENHLKDCNSCQEYYKAISSNILDERKDDKNDKFELDFLKKVKKHINILKAILLIILIAIISIICVTFIKYKNITQIINKSYEKIENVRKLDNYELTQKTIYKDYEKDITNEIITNYYYKNGKYKITNGNTTYYSEDDSNNSIYVYDDLKQIDYCKQNFAEQRKGETFDIFSEIISYKNELPGLYKLMLSSYTDRFDGIECYVIRMGNDTNHKDVWIDKNTYSVLRVVEESYLKYYREEIYTLVKDKVMDADVDSSVLETNQYSEYTKKNVTYNATEELKNIYEMPN